MTHRAAAAAIFALLLGVLWMGLSDAVSLSQTDTALIAAGFLVVAVLVVLVSSRSGGVQEQSRLVSWWKRKSHRDRVNLVAAIVAVVAGVGAGVLLFPEPNPADDSCPAKEEKGTCPKPGETTTKTTEASVPGKSKNGESTEKVTGTETVVEEKTSVAEPDGSLLGRAVDNQAGVIIVRFGLALLAGFVAGLVAQRVALGKYGVKLPFGLGEFEEISDEQAKAVTELAKEDHALKPALEAAKAEKPNTGLDVGDVRSNLVTLSQDSERELRAKAEPVPEVNPHAPIDEVIEGLRDKEVIGAEGQAALRDVIALGEQAKQGAPIEPRVRDWLAEEGQYIPTAIAKLETASV